MCAMVLKTGPIVGLLYAMRQLKLDPASGYKKCARVVGDVMGKVPPARRPIDL